MTAKVQSNIPMHPILNESTKTDAIDFAQRVGCLWDEQLGGDLAGIYLIGSLAHGGYSTRYSDIDVALITEQPLPLSEVEGLQARACEHSAILAARLSLFWTDRCFACGRFPPLDRVDYLDHALPLLEWRRASPARPTLTEIRAHRAAKPFRMWSQQVARLCDLDQLPIDDRKRYLRTLLYQAHFLYSWETGNVVSNDDAVSYVEQHGLVGSEMDIIRSALQCRNEVVIHYLCSRSDRDFMRCSTSARSNCVQTEMISPTDGRLDLLSMHEMSISSGSKLTVNHHRDRASHIPQKPEPKGLAPRP
jgi:hypothetical protein